MTHTDAPQPIATLADETLLVFLSDTHIGGDPGADRFESRRELAALFDDLTAHVGPAELVVAGDFFDFLRMTAVPDGHDRASATISRPEYRELFAALRGFAAAEGHRVVYLPGNHDAESWWNPEVQETLRREGLVHEFALSYAARFASAPGHLVYAEHGNQFDPANARLDFADPLDTPLGDHIVNALTTRIEPAGQVAGTLDLRDIGRVYPLASIPVWLAGRIFYDLLQRVLTRLLAPMVVGYLSYRLWDGYRSLPGVQAVFGEIVWDAALLVAVFVFFFLTLRRTSARTIAALTSAGPDGRPDVADTQQVRELLATDHPAPMRPGLPAREIAVFVSGHTHAPSLSRLARAGGGDAITANSGCWLRQRRPVPARFRAPPVFVSTFVQTHVRVTLGAAGLRAELWEHPRSTPERLRAIERVATLGRLPPEPEADAPPRVVASEELAVLAPAEG